MKERIKQTGAAVIGAAAKAREVSDTAAEAIVNALDANGNGRIDVEDVIIRGLQMPGIRIDRASFLRREFFKKYPQRVIEEAVASTSARAGIPMEDVDGIADEAIKFERNCVSGISAALGMPGGVTMLAAMPADIIQYYAYMLRAAQKLLYLYGFPELDTSEGQLLDSETMNLLMVCLGIMYGVAGASKGLNIMATALAKGIEKKLVNTALTKGVLYPIVKDVMKWFDISLTKQIFAGAVGKSIPMVGAVIGGGITFFSFKPCCDKLKASLRHTMLSDPSRHEEDVDIADAGFEQAE